MRALILILMMAVVVGCHYDSITYEIPMTKNYLPLEVGNYWNFKTTGGSPTQVDLHREVVSLVTINNNQYYLLVNSLLDANQVYKDSTYYRIEDNGFVYTYRKSQPDFEENPFRLNGTNHDTWTFPMQGKDQTQMTLTFGSLWLGNVEIADCKSYFFNVPKIADEEYTITLAPGIGFVKEYSDAWGVGQVLQSARINGQVFKF